MKIIIESQLTTLNDYIRAERGNRYAAAKVKKQESDKLIWGFKYLIKKWPHPLPFSGPVRIEINWYRKDRRTDPDNVAFAKKFVLDALVESGILENDSWKFIQSFSDFFFVDKERPRVEIYISKV